MQLFVNVFLVCSNSQEIIEGFLGLPAIEKTVRGVCQHQSLLFQDKALFYAPDR